jgi:hypothetical protein
VAPIPDIMAQSQVMHFVRLDFSHFKLPDGYYRMRAALAQSPAVS